MTVALALAALAAYALYPFFTTGFQWNIPLPIPQTKPVVFAEYATVGAVYLGLAAKSVKKQDKQKALFHLFSGALSFIFPTYYWNHQMRLHHSFLGLILIFTLLHFSKKRDRKLFSPFQRNPWHLTSRSRGE